MKKLTKRELLEASQLSSKRELWQSLEDLRGVIAWASQKTVQRIIPPLPFTKPKRHYISALMP